MGHIPLAILERIGLLRPFAKSVEKILISQRDNQYLMELGKIGYLNGEEINALRSEGAIEIVSAPARESIINFEKFGLKGMELEAVAKYKDIEAKFILTEDNFVRSNQEKLGVNVLSVPDIIWYLVSKGAVSKRRAIEALKELREMGLYSEDVLKQIEKNLKEPSHLSEKIEKIGRTEKFKQLIEKYKKGKVPLDVPAAELGVTPMELIQLMAVNKIQFNYAIKDFKHATGLLKSYL